MKYIYITESQKKKLAAQDQVGGKVNSGLMCYEDVTPESDSYEIGIEGGSTFDGNAHTIEESAYMDKMEKYYCKYAIATYGLTNDFNNAGFLLTDGSLLDLSNRDEIMRKSHAALDVAGANMREFISMGEIRLQPESSGIELCKAPTPQQIEGLNNFINHFKNNPAVYVDCVNDEGGRVWSKEYKGHAKMDVVSDIQNYFTNNVIPQSSSEVESDPNYVDFAYFRNMTEAKTNEDVSPEEVDLSSFNIKKGLNPKFWEDGHLDSRIRLKLLDIADDFIEFLGIDWAEPKDIIMTGSLANYNWSKQYSDIDLHIVMDFSEIDERTDFVDNYFYSQKQLWNKEHEGLSIMGYPIEVFVQDENAEHDSSGVYSLNKDKWLIEPDREILSSSKVSKAFIKERVSDYMNQIDKLLYLFKKAKNDEYKVRKISEKANKLFDKIKQDRKTGFEKSGGKEINNLNIVFKALRRNGYIEKLSDLCSDTYNVENSINEIPEN